MKIDLSEYQLHCLRCNHFWLPRKAITEIRICPKCKSARWDQKKEIHHLKKTKQGWVSD